MEQQPEEPDLPASSQAHHAKPSTADDPPTLKSIFYNATDHVLTFLSNASNESIGACLVGLGATTYYIFGRFGLVLIGVVGGVVLHATWENYNGRARFGDAGLGEAARRREVGLDVAQRILAWREKKLLDDDKDALGLDLGQSKAADFSDFRPETATALNQLTDAVIRDYVKWWYSPVIPHELVFPQSCRKTLTNFALALSANLSRKRPADVFVELTTNSSSIVIVFLNELTSALAASPASAPADAIYTYLRLKPESNLASIVDPKHQQRKLQSVADDILESYLEPAVYRCAPARVFLQKILAHVVLELTLNRCSQPEWINDWIVYLLEDGEPQIMNAIDAGVEKSAVPDAAAAAKQEEAAASSPVAHGHARGHSRTLSRAEEAMDEAMREAQRLTQMIKEDEERRLRAQAGQQDPKNVDAKPEKQKAPEDQEQKVLPPRPSMIPEAMELSDASDSTTHGVQTPSSSQSGDEQHQTSQQPQSDPEPEASPTGTDLQDEPTPKTEPQPQRAGFTSFDQIAPPRVATALSEEADLRTSQPVQESLTLHKARVVIFDDSEPVEKKTIKSKPAGDYLIQIEPASNNFPGWMIPRTYIDFEVLHEVLVRISRITGVDFGETHPAPPVWKNKTKHQLREEMERYLNDAMRYEQLAESEGMKRFLEKSRGMTQTPGKGFWPNPTTMGKGMLDVLAKAPNQVAGGGKAIFGGVANAFAGGAAMGAKRGSVSAAPIMNKAQNSSSASVDLSKQTASAQSAGRASAESDSSKKPPPSFLDVQKRPTMGSRQGSNLSDTSQANSPSAEQSRGQYLILNSDNAIPETPGTAMKLPPPPEQMPEDYIASPSKTHAVEDSVSHMSSDGTNFFDVPTPPTPRSPRPQSPPMRSPPSRSSLQQPRPRALPTDIVRSARLKEAEAKRNTPLRETEASVTIELLFAVITELYTLSSAWTLRRTLLGAAKTFLLRPGNPQLESIRVLLQETLLDANTSDTGLASHILKLRENCLPTEEELAKWPKERSPEEKEKLRQKARELLIKRGMPQALTSVMGQAASGEALAKVFDCLQVDSIARGVMFGLMLQAIRAITQ